MKTLISALVVGLAISFGAASIASAETATTPITNKIPTNNKFLFINFPPPFI